MRLPPAFPAYPWAVGLPTADRAACQLFDSAALDAWRSNRAGAVDPWRLGRTPVLASDGMAFFRAMVKGRLDGEALAYRLLRRGPGAAMSRAGAYGGGGGQRRRHSGVAHLTTTDLTLRYLLLGQPRRLAAEGHEVIVTSALGRTPPPWRRPGSASCPGATPPAPGTRWLTPAPWPSWSPCCGASA